MWEDDDTWPDNDVYGQIVSTAGTRVGGSIPICTASGLQGERKVRVACGGSRYFVVWPDARNGEENWDIYARLVNV